MASPAIVFASGTISRLDILFDLPYPPDGAGDFLVDALRDALHRANAITVYLSDVQPGSPFFRAAQHFGTRGLFHQLLEYANAPDVGRG